HRDRSSSLIDEQDRPRFEPRFDLGEREHGDLTLEAVGPGDAADGEPAVVLAHSTISTVTDTPSRVAAARTTSRMARTVRPPLPMTLPTSSGATDRRSLTVLPFCTSSTTTASGSPTMLLARNSRTSRTAGVWVRW